MTDSRVKDAWCTIEATVVSGFETVAAREIQDKLGVVPRPLYHDYDTFKGHLFFRLSESAIPNLSRLQTVDNLFVLVPPRPSKPLVDDGPKHPVDDVDDDAASHPERPFDYLDEDVMRLRLPDDDVAACLHLLRRLPAKLNWPKAYGAWRRMFRPPQRPANDGDDTNVDDLYDIPVMSEAEMLAFFEAEADEEWSGNVSWINPRLEKTKSASSKSGKKKMKKKMKNEERKTENGGEGEETEGDVAGEKEREMRREGVEGEKGEEEGKEEEEEDVDVESRRTNERLKTRNLPENGIVAASTSLVSIGADDDDDAEKIDLEPKISGGGGGRGARSNDAAADEKTDDVEPRGAEVDEEEDAASAASSKKGGAKPKKSGIPTFRATCYRGQPSGEKHAFTSQDAAKVFGGAVQSVFSWNVDMTRFDVEVVLNVSGDRVWVTLALTRESLHRRHIKHFGPTTLRSTIAMNLLKYSGLEDGETICDPLCGGGGIPIEAAYEWPNALVIAGDCHEQAFQRTKDNVDYNNDKINKASQNGGSPSRSSSSSSSSSSPSSPLEISLLRWDATSLPLRTEVVDVFVTDLPFGKRSGSKLENRLLYPKILNEFARVAKRSTGRAVFLTEDKNGFHRAFESNQSLWWKKRPLWINVGGMWAGVFLLIRNQSPWKPVPPTKNSLKQSAKKRRKLEAEAGAKNADAAVEAEGAAFVSAPAFDANAAAATEIRAASPD